MRGVFSRYFSPLFFFGYFLKKANYLGIAIVCVVMAVIMFFCIIKRKDFADKLDRIEAKHVEKNQ